ncbi:hypothetical protein CEXT_738601 [Caerostris extrusa]|uniref:Maturase K n=1 Tax=Caerostris extrusa TaxID=172846 RepID=A0AAV4SRL5_CAEEX|nr:hypothetical protein CEXT_738601 [Caerostris extrusa]
MRWHSFPERKNSGLFLRGWGGAFEDELRTVTYTILKEVLRVESLKKFHHIEFLELIKKLLSHHVRIVPSSKNNFGRIYRTVFEFSRSGTPWHYGRTCSSSHQQTVSDNPSAIGSLPTTTHSAVSFLVRFCESVVPGRWFSQPLLPFGGGDQTILISSRNSAVINSPTAAARLAFPVVCFAISQVEWCYEGGFLDHSVVGGGSHVTVKSPRGRLL